MRVIWLKGSDPFNLRSWIEEESPYHWGTNGAKRNRLTNTVMPYQRTDYRMAEGADEHGSLSFSQLVYPNRFGENSACASHHAINLNLYDPQDQVKSFVVHTASEKTTAHNCPGGMNKAFVANELGRSYELAQAADGNDIHDLVAIRGKNNLGTDEDNYEKLAKAIFYYNSPHEWISGTTRHSWPYLLKYKFYDANSAKNNTDTNVCHSCKYSIKVRRNFFGEAHLRTYIWKGGTYQAPDPKAGQEWCFAYGEKEWVDGKVWDDIRKEAMGNVVLNKLPKGRVNCSTGVALP